VPENDLGSLEEAVAAQAPPGAVLVSAAVSPDGAYGASLTFLPSATYLMDDLFVRTDESWESYGGGSGGGHSWTSLGGDERGILRYGDEAAEDASVAVVEYEGQTHRVPVRHGHFFFVAWNTRFAEEPQLIKFE
jgi:hypothetical protein